MSDTLTIQVDLSIYRQEVITAALYKLTDRLYISQNKDENRIYITFTEKLGQPFNFELLEKCFNNELIDEQVRYETEQKFGHIRNLIVEKAFAPIN